MLKPLPSAVIGEAQLNTEYMSMSPPKSTAEEQQSSYIQSSVHTHSAHQPQVYRSDYQQPAYQQSNQGRRVGQRMRRGPLHMLFNAMMENR
jgi:hypothetical protein